MFQSTMNADTLRTLSKSLKRAADKVTGTPMPLSQANEILAQTLGRASWRDALKQAATPMAPQAAIAQDLPLRMLRFMRLAAQLGKVFEWQNWERFNEGMEFIFHTCQEEYEHVQPVIIQWQDLSMFFERNRPNEPQGAWSDQAWRLLMQRFQPAATLGSPVPNRPQYLVFAEALRQAHPGLAPDMTTCTADTRFLETRAERLCFLQELTEGLRQQSRDQRNDDNLDEQDNPIWSLDALAKTWSKKPMASGLLRKDLAQDLLTLSHKGNAFDDVRMAVLLHLAFQAGRHDPFLGLGLALIAVLACENHGPLIDALSLLMTDGWV